MVWPWPIGSAFVPVGAAADLLGDEQLPRHLPHHLEDALVADAAAAQLPVDHLRPALGEVGHGPQIPA